LLLTGWMDRPHNRRRGDFHGPTSIFVEGDYSAVSGYDCVESTGHKQTTQDHDEERLGSDDPTKSAFPFLHGLALSEAGHSVQIFLLGEAVSVMRKSVASSIVPIGWPPLAETLDKIVAKRVAIYACGACCRARAVTEADLNQWGAKFGNPTIFVSLVEWADKVITE